MTSSTNAALSQWALDREIVLSRVIDARRDVVFSAWTDPKHLPSWFGPTGFKIETKEIDICVNDFAIERPLRKRGVDGRGHDQIL